MYKLNHVGASPQANDVVITWAHEDVVEGAAALLAKFSQPFGCKGELFWVASKRHVPRHNDDMRRPKVATLRYYIADELIPEMEVGILNRLDLSLPEVDVG
jgi:glyoxylase-like metal-dependent hydrolase (beta-lactamase superfamily II)